MRQGWKFRKIIHFGRSCTFGNLLSLRLINDYAVFPLSWLSTFPRANHSIKITFYDDFDTFLTPLLQKLYDHCYDVVIVVSETANCELTPVCFILLSSTVLDEAKVFI